MTEKTIAVEIPLVVVAERYLGLRDGGMYVFPARHLNVEPTDFYAVEVSARCVDNELHLAFNLKNGGRPVREVVLSLDQIFDQARKLDSLLTLLMRDRGGR